MADDAARAERHAIADGDISGNAYTGIHTNAVTKRGARGHGGQRMDQGGETGRWYSGRGHDARPVAKTAVAANSTDEPSPVKPLGIAQPAENRQARKSAFSGFGIVKQTDDVPDTGQTILVSTAENKLYVRRGGQGEHDDGADAGAGRRGGAQTTARARSTATASGASPSTSASTSSVCWPASGGGVVTASESDRRIGQPGTRNRPRVG